MRQTIGFAGGGWWPAVFIKIMLLVIFVFYENLRKKFLLLDTYFLTSIHEFIFSYVIATVKTNALVKKYPFWPSYRIFSKKVFGSFTV